MSSLPSDLTFTVNGGTYPPHGVITPDDHGAYAVVATWILTCITILSVIVRLATRTQVFQAFGRDNMLIVAAACISIAQSITIHVAVNNGLGRHRSALSRLQFDAYSKSIYASQILSMAVFCLCKLSLIIVFAYITPIRRLQLILRISAIFVILWSISSIFALAFQCAVPQTWDFSPGRCFDQGSLYYFNGVVNIVTDFLIVLFPVLIVWNVQMKVKQRLVVILMFWARIAVCVTAAIQLSTLSGYLRSSDQTWNNLVPSIWTQVVTNLSIISACVPFLKPFFDKIQSGLVDPSAPFPAASMELSSMSRPRKRLRDSFPRPGPSARTETHVLGGFSQNLGSQAALTGNAMHQTREVNVEVDRNATRSGADSEDMFLGIHV